MISSIAISVAALACGSGDYPPIDAVVVNTPDGSLRVDQVAQVEGNGTGTWLRARGVQFAEHPVGSRRWVPPVPFAPWEGVIDATEWGDDCINAPLLQRFESLEFAAMSEECLFLNVWAPSGPTPTQKLLPVMFWMHGGSFTMGGTTVYSGDYMFEYRRDVDTREAMRWVRRNIKAFGGDPDAITIFGESAGASLVETHLVTPRSNNLFSRAIMQSGPFDNYTVQTTPEDAFTQFALLANWYFSPAVDGVELTAPPEVYAEAGKLNNVSSVMLGTNLNEGRFLMPLIAPVPNGPNATVEDVKSWILANYGDLGRAVGLNSTALVAEVCKLYATELASTQPWKVASQIYTESEYLCPTERSARWLTSPPPAAPSPWKDNVFTYRLTYAPSNMIVNGEIIYWYAWCTDLIPCKNMTAEQVGVGHSSDVYLLFNRAKVGLNATDREVGHAMIDYWQGFAATGNPSSPISIQTGARFGAAFILFHFDHLGKVADDQRMNDDPVSGERERTPEEVKAFMANAVGEGYGIQATEEMEMESQGNHLLPSPKANLHLLSGGDQAHTQFSNLQFGEGSGLGLETLGEAAGGGGGLLDDFGMEDDHVMEDQKSPLEEWRSFGGGVDGGEDDSADADDSSNNNADLEADGFVKPSASKFNRDHRGGSMRTRIAKGRGERESRSSSWWSCGCCSSRKKGKSSKSGGSSSKGSSSSSGSGIRWSKIIFHLLTMLAITFGVGYAITNFQWSNRLVGSVVLPRGAINLTIADGTIVYISMANSSEDSTI
eukprot:gene8810-30552_t